MPVLFVVVRRSPLNFARRVRYVLNVPAQGVLDNSYPELVGQPSTNLSQRGLMETFPFDSDTADKYLTVLRCALSLVAGGALLLSGD